MSAFLSTNDIARLAGVTRETAWNWMTRGTSGHAGRTVKLHAFRVGGHWKTTEEHWEAFLAACKGPEYQPPPAKRQADAAARRSVESYWRSRGKAVPS